ncbi:hypothetical protein [Pleomorphomonas koreensis]|uniref:hypothetical protein n=1 Tax=Pleomorphomonas koreensis TaxID=257440 RepID=UPI00041C5A8E|nr:hypothetical protein [Pleomorphomonas koreensis]
MELSLAGVIGAAVGIGVGLIDYGLIASLIRRALERRPGLLDPRRADLLMKVLFVANAVAFAILGWWLGVTVAGTGLPAPG